jgi:hypothetical protein
MVRAMAAKDLREKAAICLQLAQGLSWNNPGRYELIDRAQDLQRRAAELETQEEQQPQQSRKPQPKDA